MSQNYLHSLIINYSPNKSVLACGYIAQWLQNKMSDDTGGENVIEVFLDEDKSVSQSGNPDTEGTDADNSG